MTRRLRVHPVFGVLAIAAAVGCILLGRWQWQRMQFKEDLQAAFDAGRAAAAAPLGDRGPDALPRYARVTLHGRYDSAHQFLLDNISRAGHAGYEVLTPFTLEDGRTVLVNRGWLPLRAGARAQLPEIGFAPGGEDAVTVNAHVDELPVTGLARGRQAPTTDDRWPKLTSFPDTAELSRALGRTVQPRQLLLDADAPNGYRRDWQPASAGFAPERHLSYAVQWWSLAALVIITWIYMNLRTRQ